MQFTKKEYNKFSKKDYNSFVLAGDIGGTNTNFGIFGLKKNNLSLLISFQFKSHQLKGLHQAINLTLDDIQKNNSVHITKACLAVAGILSTKKDFAEVTNADWDVNKRTILKSTILEEIILLNDFEAVGYGINLLGKNDIIVIKKARKVPKAPILVIGAGTGLGKSTLRFDEHYQSYVPSPSEAGHSDFGAQDKDELELIEFLKINKKGNKAVSYEEFLSGQGLSNIYLFLSRKAIFKRTVYSNEIVKSIFSPELISKYRNVDPACKAVFKIFKKIYARFAKNFALDCLPFGGVYIAGGIASKNKEIFDKEFNRIFEDNNALGKFLRKIPIYLILNYDVGLYGAGFAASRFL